MLAVLNDGGMRMRGLLVWVGGVMLCGLAALGQTVAVGAQGPKGSTGQCNDGSYTSATAKWQACGRHKGVKQWYGAVGGGGAAAKAGESVSSVAPGGGPGMVWLNPDTKVYHCPGGKFYGKTKTGRYVSEADAVKMGARPDRGKVCAK